MKRQDAYPIPILLQGLIKMPVIKMEKIKRGVIILDEPLCRGITHLPAMSEDISFRGRYTMEMNTIFIEVMISAGEIMNFVLFCEMFGQVRNSRSQSANFLCIDRFPGKYSYFKRFHREKILSLSTSLISDRSPSGWIRDARV